MDRIGIGCLLAAALMLAAAPSARAQSCTSDDDCEEGFECDLPPRSPGICDPGAGPCEPPPPAVGECEPAELRCRSDADCPDGLACEIGKNDCAVAVAPSQAGAPAPPPDCEQPTEGECVLTLVECTAHSQCEGDDACTPLGSTRECSGGAPACAPGEQCPEVPPEETCVETTRSYCFPRPIDCGQGQACAGGTRCVPLPEDALDRPPPGWEGITALCLPEHWALAIEGRIDVEDGGGGDDAADAQSESRRAGSNATKATDAASDGDDGCAVSAPGAARRAVRPFAIGAALALMLARRRRR